MKRHLYGFAQVLGDGILLLLLAEFMIPPPGEGSGALQPLLLAGQPLIMAVVGLAWRVHVGAYISLRQHARPLGGSGVAMAGATAGLVALVLVRGIANLGDLAPMLGWWLAATVALGLAQDLWGSAYRGVLRLRGISAEIWWVGDVETGGELEDLVRLKYTNLLWRGLLPSADIIDDLRDLRPGRLVHLIIMHHGVEPHLLEAIRNAGRRWAIPVRTLPSITRSTTISLGEIGLPLLGEVLVVSTLPARILKRALDLAFSLLLLSLLVLPGLLVALLILAVDRHPPLFTHRRLGRSGRPFSLLKFRSMRRVSIEDVLAASPALAEEFASHHKLAHDPRVTRLGSWLRSWSVDEIPQIVNILLGDMSVVGPRPVVREELARYRDAQDLVLSVKPGLTGLWQVSGRNRMSYEARIRLDTWYVRNWTPWLDLRIFFLTIPAVLTRRGAF